MEAAACWGTYSCTNIPRSTPPTTLTILDLNPDTVISDRALFYERVRRTMIAKSILGTFKHSAINTLMLKKDLFR